MSIIIIIPFSFCQESEVFIVCCAWYFSVWWTVAMVQAAYHSPFVFDTIGWDDLQELIHIHIYSRAQLFLSAMYYCWENYQLRHSHWHNTPGIHQNQFSPVHAELTEIEWKTQKKNPNFTNCLH